MNSDGSLVSFEGMSQEHTRFVWKGEECLLTVDFYQTFFTTPNNDNTLTKAEHILLKNPRPIITAERVTFFSIGSVRKRVVSYNYDVVSGICEIKYTNCYRKVK